MGVVVFLYFFFILVLNKVEVRGVGVDFFFEVFFGEKWT